MSSSSPSSASSPTSLPASASPSASGRRAVGPVLVWGGFALLLAVAPLVFSGGLGQTILSQIGIAIIVCLSYNMLLGQGGMLSFGHAVYAGFGAFMGMHALNLVADGRLPLPVSLVPVAGGLAAMALAMVLGHVSTKKAGTPFAMITLGIGELVWASALMFPEFFGGEGGISGNRVAAAEAAGFLPGLGLSYGPQIQMYGLIALYTFACTAAMYAFTRTPLGRISNAVRDNPERVLFIGYDTRRVRYLVFVISAFFAGIAGGLTALNAEIVTAEVVGASRSGAYLLFTFVGGTTFFMGPIIGGVLMVLAFALLSEFTRAWLLYLGIAFVAMVLWAPGGLASLVMANVRVAAHGRLKALLPAYLALAATLLTALLGAATLIEMVYHLQLNAALGPALTFLGLPLNAKAPGHWIAAAIAMVAGLALFSVARRRFADRWEAAQAVIEEETRRRDAR
ncbi:branched-chain amino acid ABC transporter permease [Mitsuaria sp. GD03876]|uniref:branched-chain amino acid ABC transporter permease n=1 Tax=Mitsuaria sp. GD03876 TaxID=2975399 RepID=UPI00244D0A85|nr:branched-chain amino acid ABC transporter permease [Mitsuaria sp. GD03876]MDH0866499.1 branched-chain amino acid ABC transporter permease [Mitsuaria sp. GD03876]